MSQPCHPTQKTEDMAIPFLLLATPRAGELNHRFLCSHGAGLTDETAWAWINAASKRLSGDGDVAVGPDFLAVIQRNVSQVLGGRKGEEILLLGGIDTAVANVADVKGKLLARVAELKGIATSIAPSAKGMLIDSRELTEWLASDYKDIPPISAAKTVSTSQSDRYRTRHIVAGFALLAASAGLGATLYHFLQVPQTPSSLPDQPDARTLNPGSPAPLDASQEVLNDLVQAIQRDPRSREKELEELVVRGKPASELASCFDKQGDPVALLRMLNPNPADANALMNALELKAPVASKEIIEWRAYLRSWRRVLGQLRDAGKKADLKRDESLKGQPLLRFIAELTGDRYCCLDDPQSKIPPPDFLPVFSVKDQETVTALRELLCKSRAGQDCLTRLDVSKDQHRLLLVLRNLHTADVSEKIWEEGGLEIHTVEASGGKSVAVRKYLQPQILAFADFIKKIPPVEAVRTSKVKAD